MLVCQKDVNETGQNSVEVQNQSHNVTIGNYLGRRFGAFCTWQVGRQVGKYLEFVYLITFCHTFVGFLMNGALMLS